MSRAGMWLVFAVAWLLNGTADAHGAAGLRALVGTWKLVAFESKHSQTLSIQPLHFPK